MIIISPWQDFELHVFRTRRHSLSVLNQFSHLHRYIPAFTVVYTVLIYTSLFVAFLYTGEVISGHHDVDKYLNSTSHVPPYLAACPLPYNPRAC